MGRLHPYVFTAHVPTLKEAITDLSTSSNTNPDFMPFPVLSSST